MTTEKKIIEIDASTTEEYPVDKVTNRGIKEFFSVILVIGRMVEANHLYFNLEQAEAKYIDLIRENHKIEPTQEEIDKYLKDRFVIFEKGSLFLDQPVTH